MATYTFVTPTLEQGPIGRHRLFTHFKQRTKSYTVINESGTYSLVQYPLDSDLATYTAYYIGGCNHTGVSDTVRTAMIAAGIGIDATNFTAE
jgi:hypothetical protein